ncbi:helix-turn-helix domain-containing protein [Microbacterium sp.]|uniref:AraC-like ligand-binding domain-containing protein n=1 Tax=Microbacterium sp. TaxID=51671 RepID=UPI0039E4F2CE
MSAPAIGLVGASPAAAASPVATARSVPAFAELVASSFVPLEITTDREAGFAARLLGAQANDVLFTEVAATAHTVTRTERAIAAGGSGFYKVNLILQGTGLLIQDGREVLLRPGDISVYDTSRPYTLHFDDTVRNLVTMLPQSRLSLHPSSAAELMATAVRADEPLSPVLASFLRQFPLGLHGIDAPVRARVGDTCVALVDTLFAQLLGQHGGRDPRREWHERIDAFIDAHLGDPALSPAAIAAAHYISLRQLHALFADRGLTVAATIREKRLARCRADLTDPLHAAHTVAELAARWGFTDAAHFSRTFKRQFGVTPRELRAA